MNALHRRLKALESLTPAPEPVEGLSAQERYMRLIAAPLPRQRLPRGTAIAPAEAYRMMCEALPSPVLLYTPGQPLPPRPAGVPVPFYLPENHR